MTRAHTRAATETRSTTDLVQELDSSDPTVGLRAVAALGRLLNRLEALHVDHARSQGWSWQDIASALGVTKQTVHRKHGKRTDPARHARHRKD